jgi:succinate dehydrogenase hydrophobic anchor subunit
MLHLKPTDEHQSVGSGAEGMSLTMIFLLFSAIVIVLFAIGFFFFLSFLQGAPDAQRTMRQLTLPTWTLIHKYVR